MGLVEGGAGDAAGLALVPSFYYWEEACNETEDDFAALWWKDMVGSFRVLRDDELPPGTAHGVEYTTFVVNPTKYMSYVLDECRKLGGRTLKARVGALGEVWTMEGLAGVDAVVNCSGMGARELAGDENVYPVKGQTVLVKGEYNGVKFRKTKDGWQDLVLRRPGEGTILGVSKDKNDWFVSGWLWLRSDY